MEPISNYKAAVIDLLLDRVIPQHNSILKHCCECVEEVNQGLKPINLSVAMLPRKFSIQKDTDTNYGDLDFFFTLAGDSDNMLIRQLVTTLFTQLRNDPKFIRTFEGFSKNRQYLTKHFFVSPEVDYSFSAEFEAADSLVAGVESFFSFIQEGSDEISAGVKKFFLPKVTRLGCVKEGQTSILSAEFDEIPATKLRDFYSAFNVWTNLLNIDKENKSKSKFFYVELAESTNGSVTLLVHCTLTKSEENSAVHKISFSI